MWGRIVWLYKNILGEDRLTLNSLKEMINYTGKIRIRSIYHQIIFENLMLLSVFI